MLQSVIHLRMSQHVAQVPEIIANPTVEAHNALLLNVQTDYNVYVVLQVDLHLIPAIMTKDKVVLTLNTTNADV